MSETIKDVFFITPVAGSGERPPKDVWTKIGVAFPNRDGSLNVVLEAIPLGGKLHIRDRRDTKPVSQFYQKEQKQ